LQDCGATVNQVYSTYGSIFYIIDKSGSTNAADISIYGCSFNDMKAYMNGGMGYVQKAHTTFQNEIHLDGLSVTTSIASFYGGLLYVDN